MKLAEDLMVTEDDGMSENNDLQPMCTPPLPVEKYLYANPKHLPRTMDLKKDKMSISGMQKENDSQVHFL